MQEDGLISREGRGGSIYGQQFTVMCLVCLPLMATVHDMNNIKCIAFADEQKKN